MMHTLRCVQSIHMCGYYVLEYLSRKVPHQEIDHSVHNANK